MSCLASKGRSPSDNFIPLEQINNLPSALMRHWPSVRLRDPACLEDIPQRSRNGRNVGGSSHLEEAQLSAVGRLCAVSDCLAQTTAIVA